MIVVTRREKGFAQLSRWKVKLVHIQHTHRKSKQRGPRTSCHRPQNFNEAPPDALPTSLSSYLCTQVSEHTPVVSQSSLTGTGTLRTVDLYPSGPWIKTPFKNLVDCFYIPLWMWASIITPHTVYGHDPNLSYLVLISPLSRTFCVINQFTTLFATYTNCLFTYRQRPEKVLLSDVFS